MSEKELKKKDDVPDWRRVTSSETALCFLAQHTDKSHSNSRALALAFREALVPFTRLFRVRELAGWDNPTSELRH